MTVAIPEARAVSTRPATRAASRQPKVIQGRVIQGSQGPPGPPPPRRAPPLKAAPKARAAPKRKAPPKRKRRPSVTQYRPHLGKAKSQPNYQGVIAAEFGAAILLTVVSPFATKSPKQTSQPGKLSPYEPGDLVKLWAIGMTYMILEMIAAGPRAAARFAAWFGFLIFLAIGLNELANITQIFKVISGAEVNPVQLVGSQQPATKGSAPVPPLASGSTPSPKPPPSPSGGQNVA